MLQNVLNIYKRLGETPLAALERFRALDAKYANVSLSYAGRLDPMAEGVLVVLTGEENKRRDAYLSLRKEYIVDILFGFETDSYDVLGLASSAHAAENPNMKMLAGYLSALMGEHEQEYPAYSSKTVLGKPLFAWAREGTIGSIEIPRKKIEIYACDHIATTMISIEELRPRIFLAISAVQGDFRQKEISAQWEEVLATVLARVFTVVKLRIACSSGTYVRSIAHDIGKNLGTSALALHIVRTKVGDIDIEDSLR